MARQRMTREEAILDILENAPQIGRPQAEDMVDKNIGDDPNYYKVKLVDVDKKEKKSKEPKQRQDKLKWKATEVHPGPDTMGDISNMLKALLKSDQIQSLLKGGKGDEGGPTDLEAIREETQKDLKFNEDVDLENWFNADEEPTEETQEERLERQIEHFNNMRSHVSDLDEDYLLDDAPRDHWEQGLQSRPDEREMTQIVEALQRKAMQQGNVGATAQLPIGPVSNQGLNYTPANQNLQGIIQALQNQNQMGSPGSDVNSLYDPYNARQTLRYGGGQQGYAHPGIRGGPSRFGGGGSNTPSYL